MLKLATIIFLLITFSKASFSQSISNPSFEGEPKKNYPPQGWAACDGKSTPDTQPGFWSVTQRHGEKYSLFRNRSRKTDKINFFKYIVSLLLHP